jgi:hypothetical protein
VDAFIAWFRDTLQLRFEAHWAAQGEEDYDLFVPKRDAYFARHPPEARSPTFADRDDDDDISFLAPNLVSMKVAAFFAAIRHPAERFTAYTSTERDSGHGLRPVKVYTVAKLDGEWSIVGTGGFRDGEVETEYGVSHAALPIEDVRYLDPDRLAESAADFVGSIEIG